MQFRDFHRHLTTTQWPRAIAALFVVIFAVSVGVGVTVLQNKAREDADADVSRRQQIFSDWQMEITSRFTRAGALAATVASFAMANATIPMNYSASPASRMSHMMNEEAFRSLCHDLYRDNPGVLSLILLPGGISAQIYPVGSISYGVDAINMAKYWPAFVSMLGNGEPTVTGPTPMSSRVGISINVWHPVFVSPVRNRDTFWGASAVMLEILGLLTALNVSRLVTDHNMDYVMWYHADIDPTNATTLFTSNNHTTSTIIDAGMRMQLPIAEVGRTCFFSIHPRGGIVSDKLKSSVLIAVILGTLAAATVACFLLVAALYGYFIFRHRKGPQRKAPHVFMAAITLRGAQPIAERAPLEAVRMFSEFNAKVCDLATVHGCYVVCDIGDRCVYVTAKRAELLFNLAQDVVAKVSVRADMGEMVKVRSGDGRSKSKNVDVDASRSKFKRVTDANTSTTNQTHHKRDESIDSSATSMSPKNDQTLRRITVTEGGISEGDLSFEQLQKSTNTHRKEHRGGATVTAANDDNEEAFTIASSFIANVVCRPSVAIHSTATRLAYDISKDRYFYGTARDLAELGAAVDGLQVGEVGWTAAVEKSANPICREFEHKALQYNSVEENGKTVLHVATLMFGDADSDKNNSSSNEDPSVAMAIIGDAYVRRMAVIVSEGLRVGGTQSKKDKEGETRSGHSSNKSADATTVTRNATLLYISVATADGAKSSFDIIRGIAEDEKGTIVSTHETTIVIAFNLLTPGGHHQVRSADTVLRIRSALPSVPFVCSIHQGKLTALVADGRVMCLGEVPATGRSLLHVAMDAVGVTGCENEQPASIAKANALSPLPPPPPPLSKDVNGLCLLYAVSEPSSTYECEAVDVVQNTVANSDGAKETKLKVVYRLAHRKSGKGNDDEWMYRLKDEEDQSPFAAVNAVFNRIAAGQVSDAARLWVKAIEEQDCSMMSDYARHALERYFSAHKQDVPKSGVIIGDKTKL